MKLTVFTKNNCIQCKMTKKFLEQHNISFKEKNISQEPQYIDYLRDHGFQTVPVIEENNEPVINGFRPDLLRRLIAD